MARKRAENRERSLGFPGFVKPVFTKDSKPLGKRKRSLGTADVDKANISTPAAVSQRAANCQEEAVRSFTAMRNRCQSLCTDITFRRPLPVFLKLFGARWSTTSKLALLLNCSAAHELLLHDRKILLLKDQ
ncbi:uncharacterized protein TNCV_1415041 [Trichonephila clavipes]|nr:uncharacterized protein TNCV_1415041 [Trichonephila clavipes]